MYHLLVVARLYVGGAIDQDTLPENVLGSEWPLILGAYPVMLIYQRMVGNFALVNSRKTSPRRVAEPRSGWGELRLRDRLQFTISTTIGVFVSPLRCPYRWGSCALFNRHWVNGVYDYGDLFS